MFYKKAQTATEYMIILAVVIIIALIVVGVLGGIPGIGGGARGRSSSAYWQTADIAIPAYSVSPTATTLKIRNNLRDTITIDCINMSVSGSAVASIAIQNDATHLVLSPGQTATVIGDATDLCATAGDSFTSNVWINYTNDETGAVYKFSGEGNKLEGVCAN